MQLTGAGEEPKDKPQRSPAVEGLGEANGAGEGSLERMWGNRSCHGAWRQTGPSRGGGLRPVPEREGRGLGRATGRTEHVRLREPLSSKTEIKIELFFCSESVNPAARG